jgi:crotonobetainyl-CoA:carnitine CoA-transferase CaiB-like acyl-CoA transferase
MSGPDATLLAGVVVSAPGADPATATCARHLARLGATVVRELRDDADVLLRADAPALVGGGLAGSETTVQAALGLTDYVGPAGGAPERLGAEIACSAAGVAGATRVLAALGAGAPRPLEVHLSPLHALGALKTILWAARSRPDAWVGTHVRSRERLVDCGYATRDGRVTLDFAIGRQERWRAFAVELGLSAHDVERLAPRWLETVGWGDDVDDARPLYEALLRERTTEEAIALIRSHGGSSVPFLTPEECLAHPHAQALGLEQAMRDGVPWRLRGGAEDAVLPDAGTAGFDPDRPLAGVRVVDFGVGGVGPYSATLLAWLGADVVKVEAPNEFILDVRPTLDGLSTTYLALNQGKRSVSLDLKQPADRELALELVADADVLTENFRPGALERLGLGFDAVAAVNPRIVYCSATGFGWEGPLASEPCTDPHMQAFSGFAALNAGADELPRRIRYYGFVDLVTSCVIAEAACAGLLARSGATPGAVRVETSMLHAATDAHRSVLTTPPSVPDGIWATADGHVALTCRDDAEWRTLVAELGAPPDLSADATAEARRADRGRIDAALARVLATRPSAAWAHALGRAGVPCARVAHDEEALARGDLRALGVLRDLPVAAGEPLTCGGPPWPPVGAPFTLPAPSPGADGDALRAGVAGFWRDASRTLA